MNRVSVPGRSRARGGSILHGLVRSALIALPLAMVSCGGGDDGGGGGGGGGGNNPPSGGSTATQFAYVINSGADTIQAYRSDPDGTLTPIGTPPTPLATGDFPHHVRVDPRGRFVYVSNHSSTFLSGYRINQDGTLAPMNSGVGSPVTGTLPGEAGSHSSVIDETGQFLYVIAGPETAASTLRAYRIDTTPGPTLGNLTALTAAGGSFPVGVHAHNMTLSPNNLFLYTASEGSGEVHAFSRDTTTGLLTPRGVTSGLPGVQAVTVDPQSRFVYASYPNVVEVLEIGADGSLTRFSPPRTVSTGNGPHALTIHPNGRFLYVANIADASISVYRVDPNTGSLTSIETEPTGNNPNYVIVHPNLTTLYTADAIPNQVSRFTINQDGTLAPAGTVPAGAGANGIGTTKF
ncbi:lactonase family protein [Nitrospira moscoviensis]|uniref:Putative 6-phosphogluconolactonase n=1 Tax=Nitrospira moscoviensis TaxID=42253 RepID=A0A0K2GDD0_NITMO|nr:beta-propeller fold lactonase family protein [Nitrospira moscoviensis]ALA58948.1 putative 6-phosphogluconolactonase [Nitrospira moscoviensis]